MLTSSAVRASRLAIALAAVTAAIPLTFLVSSLRQHPVSLLLVAIVVCAWVGLREALLAMLLAVLALGLFFLPPLSSLEAGLEDLLRLGVFLLAGGITVAVMTSSRQREAAAHQQGRHKDEFLALLAHELRTPLSSFTYALEALRGQPDTLRLQQACAIMERQVHAMTRLLEDLEDAAAVRQGKLHLRRCAVDLSVIVTHALDTTRRLFEEKRLHLAVESPAEPLPLWADPDRLGQVTINLLRNAARYTDPGGHVWLAVRRDKTEVVVTVRDTGVGFDPTLAARLFDLFVQQSGRRGGLGIGLSLVRTIVELHGGTVTAASAGPGKGSEFAVRLPLA
jgi:signal transduction histidine kinase